VHRAEQAGEAKHPRRKTFKAIEMRAKINGYGKLLRML
jgi:hypothetical protein